MHLLTLLCGLGAVTLAVHLLATWRRRRSDPLYAYRNLMRGLPAMHQAQLESALRQRLAAKPSARRRTSHRKPPGVPQGAVPPYAGGRLLSKPSPSTPDQSSCAQN